MDLPRASRPYLSSARPFAKLLCAAVLGTLLLEAPVLHAQEQEEEAPAHIQYRRAFELMRDKRWMEARRLLLDLWLKSKTYDVAASLGQVEYQLRNYASGARYLAFALANVPPMEKPETVQRFKNAFDEIKRHVAVAEINVRPADADVLIDGAAQERETLGAVYLEPGRHNFEARSKTGNATARELELQAGEDYKVDLQVNTAPDAASGAGGAPANSGSEQGAAPGAAGKERSLVPVYIGAGVTAIGVGLTIAFGAAARGARDEADSLRARIGANGCTGGSASASDCSAAMDAYERQRRDATIAKVGLGVAVAGGLATAGYLIFTIVSPRETAASAKPNRVRPIVAFDGQSLGLTVIGAF